MERIEIRTYQELIKYELKTKLISALKVHQLELKNLLEVLWIFILAKFEHTDELQWGNINNHILEEDDIKSNSKSLHFLNLSLQLQPDITILKLTTHIQKQSTLARITALKNLFSSKFTVLHQTQTFTKEITPPESSNEVINDLNGIPASLLLTLEDTSEQVLIKISHLLNAWPEWQVQEILESYRFLIANALHILDTPLSQISILSPRQWAWLQEWNKTNISLTFDNSH